MKWNPVLGGAGAAAYIAAVVFVMQYITSFRANTPDTPLDGVSAISLLVFSVAVMAFLFFYRPTVLLIENKKEAALAYFFKTLATFGVITLVMIGLLIALYS